MLTSFQEPTPVPIRVFVRICPTDTISPAIQYDEHSITLSARNFTYDAVYGTQSSQEDVWNGVKTVAEGVCDGVNGTILAYGQTGTGKTFSMGTEWHRGSSSQDRGLIQRAVERVFADVEEKSQDGQIDFKIAVSFLEIYQEKARDLLCLGNDSRDLSIRKDKHGMTVVNGLSQIAVTAVDDALRYIDQGGNIRTTGDTQMNESSSRSHAIFILHVEKRSRETGTTLCASKLCLVDLAGSERLKRTKASGLRFKESIKINTGLLALSNVISVLGSESNGKGSPYIPYRESRLTYLLSDSLGGNAKTVMIACVSPAPEDFDETLNTLK